MVFVLVEGQLKGAMALADIVRPEAKQAIAALKARTIRCMLTGDNKATAKWVSDQVGLDEVFAEVLPKGKITKVKEVQARGALVAMVGDGVNDAPALAQADAGLAIGTGSDVAVETADILLVRSNPMDVVATVVLSRATYRKMTQNLLWATGYNVIAIPLAAGGLHVWGVVLSPAVAATRMAARTVIVVVNAGLVRLKKRGCHRAEGAARKSRSPVNHRATWAGFEKLGPCAFFRWAVCAAKSGATCAISTLDRALFDRYCADAARLPNGYSGGLLFHVVLGSVMDTLSMR